jgi:hypothetical protein
MKEQTEHPQQFHTNLQNCTARSRNQVISKLYLASVQIVCASAPEVTSMQVLECIGEERKPHSIYPCLRFVYLGEFKGCDWSPFFAW